MQWINEKEIQFEYKFSLARFTRKAFLRNARASGLVQLAPGKGETECSTRFFWPLTLGLGFCPFTKRIYKRGFLLISQMHGPSP